MACCPKANDARPPGMGTTTSVGTTNTSTPIDSVSTPALPESVPITTPPETIQVCSTCNQVLVQLRPHSTYDGEFGFDWIRLGDTSMYGDALPYADFNTTPTEYNMLGKYYKDSRNLIPIRSLNGWKVCTNDTTGVETIVAQCVGGTESTNWKVSPSQYSDLTNSFKTISIPWKRAIDSNFEYYVPILTLIPDEGAVQGNSAKLAVHIEVSIASSHIKIKPQRTDTGVEFKVDGIVSDNLTINAGVHDAHLEVRCTKALSSNLDVDIYADDKLCGRFTILQNNSSVVINKKILLVQVKSDCNGSKIHGTPKSGGKELLDNCLKQALIKADIKLLTKKLDVTSVKTGGVDEFRDRFATVVSGEYKITKQHGLFSYLNSKFAMQFPLERYDYVVYFTEEKGNWNGFARSEDKAGVYFPTHSKSTIAHELFHAMGLRHSFTNIEANSHAKFTYKATMTNNLMDYSHLVHEKRMLTYHWQWKILNWRVPNA